MEAGQECGMAWGDTPYWQPVQECSAVRANHGRAPSLSHQSEEVEAFL